MDYSFAKIDKNDFTTKFLPYIPTNKRGFTSKFNMYDIFRCIVHKAKTGCQWEHLFVDLECVKYQHRKKGRTSNVLVLTDGRGYPIGIGDIISGNHNDLYDIIGQFSKIMNQIKKCSICVENSYLNADKGFDCKKLRRAIHCRKMFPNIKENPRNCKGNKRGKKRFFDEKVYKKRFVNECSFA